MLDRRRYAKKELIIAERDKLIREEETLSGVRNSIEDQVIMSEPRPNAYSSRITPIPVGSVG